jgi:hypothetical protein
MLGFGSLTPLFTHIVSIWVEDRGDVGLISTDGSNVEYISEVELGGIIVQEDGARLDGVEHDVLLLDVNQALEELDCDAGCHLQHLGTIPYDLPQHNVML